MRISIAVATCMLVACQQREATGPSRRASDDGSSRAAPLQVCIDRALPASAHEHATDVAVAENAANRGEPEAPSIAAASKKLWKPGRRLRVRFLEGSATVTQKVQHIATRWTEHAHLHLVFDNSPDAEIRIAFNPGGSWSMVGTDALSEKASKPTMNYGWLTDTTSDAEYERVVLHEFGHALGLVHEHQSPGVQINWNKQAVYELYAGEPNHWDQATVDFNIFRTYAKSGTNFSKFDKTSIMLYAIPAQLTTDGTSVGWNKTLSEVDKCCINQWYPKPGAAVCSAVACKQGG